MAANQEAIVNHAVDAATIPPTGMVARVRRAMPVAWGNPSCTEG
jgi:hypothetical protein